MVPVGIVGVTPHFLLGGLISNKILLVDLGDLDVSNVG